MPHLIRNTKYKQEPQSSITAFNISLHHLHFAPFRAIKYHHVRCDLPPLHHSSAAHVQAALFRAIKLHYVRCRRARRMSSPLGRLTCTSNGKSASTRVDHGVYHTCIALLDTPRPQGPAPKKYTNTNHTLPLTTRQTDRSQPNPFANQSIKGE